MCSLQDSFLLDEIKCRRQDIDSLVKHTEKSQQYALILIGAFWSWTITQIAAADGLLILLSCIFFNLVLIFLFKKWQSYYAGIERLAKYVKSIEEYFELPNGLGWETHVYRVKHSDKRGNTMYIIQSRYWLTTISLNIMACIIFAVSR